MLLIRPVMPDCGGVDESRVYSKSAKKNPSPGFVPQSGITATVSIYILSLKYYPGERRDLCD